MSRATPRKSRHRHHPSSGGVGVGFGGPAGGSRPVAASDYESDAAHYMEARDFTPAPHLLHRTNTDLNLSVLQRYLPSIQAIVSIAANAVIYIFSPDTGSWDKSGVEGTLFVCEQEPLLLRRGTALPRSCVFVLNRRGLDNVVLDLSRVSYCEFSQELLIFNVDGPSAQDGQDAAAQKVVGVWMHADQDDTREVNTAIIQEAWKRVRLAGEALADPEAAASGAAAAAVGAGVDVDGGQESLGPAMQAMGRKLSLSDLFGQRNGNAHLG